MRQEVRDQLLEALLQAIEAEVQGYHFYKTVARTTEDPRGREVFQALARDEQQHATWLRTQYRSLLETGSFDLEADRGEPQHDPSAPIFSDRFKDRAASAHFEMTALSVGVQLESDARKHYREMAVRAEEPEISAFFEELAEWEYGHYRTLLAQQEALEQAYWAANRFAPF